MEKARIIKEPDNQELSFEVLKRPIGFAYKIDGAQITTLVDEIEVIKDVIFKDFKPQNLYPPLVLATVKDETQALTVENIKKVTLEESSEVITMTTEIIQQKNPRFSFNYSSFFVVNVQLGVNSFKDLSVYFKNKWNGTDFTPEFLIDFNSKEINATHDKDNIELLAFTISFSLDFPVCPKYVTTYLWDEDPIGSRGTVTTVKPTTKD